MWIAKPVISLSTAERNAWIEAQRRLAAQGETPPLSQRLAWADAIQALEGRAFLVMSADEAAGGVVHSLRSGHFECTNGPLLDWDDFRNAPRQLATFATAVSKLARGFVRLELRPRWTPQQTELRLAHLPIQPARIVKSSTIQVPVESAVEAQRARSTPRMRRSLALLERYGVQTRWSAPTHESLSGFVNEMRQFGENKGFYVPGEVWFRALVFPDPEHAREALSFYLCDSWSGPGETEGGESRSRLLICFDGPIAYFLYGYDKRGESAPAALSTAAAAHFRALEECARAGLRLYDLNGYVDPAEDPDHPYAGVSRFKAQFGGRVVDYVSPEFRIE